jgi:dUTP pyrophosphatase
MSQLIDVLCLIENEDLKPHYVTEGAAGADLKANIKEPQTIAAGQSTLIPTGIRMAIPTGYEIQIRPRSGLALKNQITILNTPGTIDSDYRGEIGIILINHGKESFIVTPGMRVAQLILAPVAKANFVISHSLPDTVRGDGGFGHTGRG